MSKYRLGDYTVKNWNSWDRVPRDPVTVGVMITQGIGYGAAAAGLAAGTIAAGFGTAVIGYLATSLVTSWAINALTPKPDFGAQTSGQILSNSISGVAAQDFVYGKVRKGGIVTFFEATGDENKYLHQIIVLAGHEVHSVDDIYINDQIATFSGDFVTTAGSGDEQVDWDSKIRIKKFDGSQTTADSDLVSETSVDSNFKGLGLSYLYVRYEYDEDVFASGVPTVTAIVRGKKVYDPRTTNTAYSNNAALCIRDFLTSSYGLADTAIDDVSFAAAANECDESISLSGGGTENRYELNGIVQANRPVGDVLGDMVTSCAGTLFWGSGYWKLKAGAYSAPVKTLTLDDLRSPINLGTRITMRDNFNRVSGTFNDAAQNWITADYPQLTSTTNAGSFVTGDAYTITKVGNTNFTAIGAASNTVGVTFTATGAGSGTGKASAFLGQDNGEEAILDLPLPFTTSSSAAQRLAKLTLFRGREQMSFSADFGLEAFSVEVGDIIGFTNERYGFSAKEFEVIGWKFASNQDAGDLRITLTLRETSAAAFNWNAEETAITSNDTTLPRISAGTNILGLSLADGGSEVQGDGTVENSLIASWTASTNAFVTHYQVEWGQTSSANRQSLTTPDNTVLLAPVIDGVEYTVRVRSVSVTGFRGAYASATATSGGDTTAPAKVTSGSLEAVGVLEGIEVKWENPADADFSHVEIYESNNSNFSNATQVGRSSGNTFLRGNIVGGTTKYFWVRTKDFSGNPTGSAIVGQTRGPVNATSKIVTAADIEGAVIGYENLAEDVDVLLQDARKKVDDLGAQSLTEVLGRYKDRKRSEERDASITQDMSAGINEANQAVADLRTELVSQFDGNLAAIVDQLTTVADGASANATSIEGLIADVDGNTGAISEINTVSADSSSALARSVASLDVDVADNTASIVAINDVSASSDSAAAQSLFSLNASVSGIETDVSNAQADIVAAEADILQINNVAANSTSAIAQSVNDLNVALEFDDGTDTYGRITEISDLRADVTGVEAKYGVTVDANGNVGGFQLLSGEGGSAFNVAADQFNIFNPDGDTSGRPFTVFSTLREIDGITYPIGVYMDQAYIDTANIVDATITSAKIKDAAITNAKIGNVIQSENYSTGSTGWQINKDGSAEFNGVVISRQLLVDSGTLNVGNVSITPVASGFTQSLFQYVEATNVNISAWAGSQRTYLCNVGMTGTVNAPTSAVPNVYWGWTGEILPLTRWSGDQTLRLKLVFWTRNIQAVTNLQANWKIYEVT